MQRVAAVVLASALVAAGCASVEPARPAVKLYALDCGSFEMANAASFSDAKVFDGQAASLSNPCYLVRHPAGDLMWDAGIPPAMTAAIPAPTAPVKMYRKSTITAQLAQLGMTPADVEFFSISHSHFDHLGEGNLFAPTATWIVDKDERDWMFRPDGRKAIGFSAYSALETAKTTLIEGAADHDVFGDGSVTIIQAPGHTPGHTILLVKTAGAGPILLAGDMWHLAQSREKRTVPTGNTDRGQTLASMDKVEALAASTGAKVIRQHVPEDFAGLPAFPAAID